MTLKNFFKNYAGADLVSIDGYVEEGRYDYFKKVPKSWLSDDNPNHYKPTTIVDAPWWDEVKNRQIKRWNIIGGYDRYPVEIVIELETP